MSELAVTTLADRPRPRGGPSAVKSSNPPEINIVSGTILRLACGPSAPQERTVRSLTFEPKPEKQPLWYKPEISRRTVRRSTLKPTLTGTLSGTSLKNSSGPSAQLGRTVRQPIRASASSLERARIVRPSGADCPPLLSQLSNLVYFKSFQKRR